MPKVGKGFQSTFIRHNLTNGFCRRPSLQNTEKIGETVTVEYEIYGEKVDSTSFYLFGETLNGHGVFQSSQMDLPSLSKGSVNHTIVRGDKAYIVISINADGQGLAAYINIDVENADPTWDAFKAILSCKGQTASSTDNNTVTINGRIGETLTIEYELSGGGGNYRDSVYEIKETLNGTEVAYQGWSTLPGHNDGSIVYTIQKGDTVQIWLRAYDRMSWEEGDVYIIVTVQD